MRFFIITFIVAWMSGLSVYSQKSADDYRLIFYNPENLFDTIDNPFTHDEEFLYTGDKGWSGYRYWRKINQIFQIIAATGSNNPPDIIGMCEVEDFLPLYHIVNNTPLVKFNYKIIHKNSPDQRGIDVAVLVRSDRVKILEEHFETVVFSWDTSLKTRDILYTKLLLSTDTLHLFVNHWPSRRGGQIKSEPKRMAASGVVARLIDSIQKRDRYAQIMVTGDFNDEPMNSSLRLLEEKVGLINKSHTLKQECNCGTYKYKSHWNMLDQLLISEGLNNPEKGFVFDSLYIYDAGFLLVPDRTYGGQKPFRTYLGPQYIGGFSDHLPIVVDFHHTK